MHVWVDVLDRPEGGGGPAPGDARSRGGHLRSLRMSRECQWADIRYVILREKEWR